MNSSSAVRIRSCSVALLVLLGGCGTARFAVLTQHNDVGRTGAYLSETRLTPAQVDPATGPGMWLHTWRPTDGKLEAQLLYAPRVSVTGGTRNLVLAFSMGNTAYAYDLDEEGDPGTNRGLVWQHTFAGSGALATPMGIYSTPVVDLDAGVIYLVYGLSNGMYPWNGVGDGSYQAEFHLAALDLRTGAPLRDLVVSGSVPSAVAPGTVVFEARRQVQRAGLLMTANPLQSGEKTIYIPFCSRWREETHNWHGWMLAYDAATFAPRGAYCSSPDRRADSEGGGIWQGGAGPAADSAGNVYFNTGNGPGSGNDHGNSIVKLTPALTGGTYGLTAIAFSAAADDPAHAAQWAGNDIDLAGGGVTVLPGSSQLAGGGKTGVIYLMDRGALTKVQAFDAFTNSYDPSLRYNDWMTGPHMHGAPTYWVSGGRGLLYHWGEKDRLKRFDHDRTTWRLGTTPAGSGGVVAESDLMPGGLISLSANGDRDGILWITLPSHGGGRLFAFDAMTLRRLWEASIPVAWGHSNPPTIAEGRVLAGASDGTLYVYGLAPRMLRRPPRALRPPPYWPDPGPLIDGWLKALPQQRATALVPPRGQRAVFLGQGTGSLTYVARKAAGGAGLEWAEVAVTGALIDQSGVMPNMGRHGLGHELAKFDQGMTLAGAHAGRLSLAPATAVPAPEAKDADWALFRASSGQEPGPLSGVTFVQRLATRGGRPPAPPTAEGQQVEVPYEAAYAFYAPAD